MLYYMLNKPHGLITACRDEFRPTIMECFPPDLAARLHPVGRLDIDTRGLIIMTDDGRLDPAMMHPDHHVDKEYFFYAIGTLDEEKIRRLESGVPIDADGALTRPATVLPGQVFRVSEIRDFLPEFRRQRYLKNPEGPAFSASLIIHEGRKHEVKLMLRAVNCRICYLKRVAVGGIRLDSRLGEGEYRPLTPEEVRIIEQIKENAKKNVPEAEPFREKNV